MNDVTNSPNPSTPSADVSRPSSQRLGMILAGIGALVLVGYFYLDSRNAQRLLVSQVQQNADLQKQLANLEETVSDIKTSKLYREQDQTVARDSSLATLQFGELAETRIADLRKAILTWQTTRDNSLEGDEGRRIASDPKLVEQVRSLLNTSVPPPELPDQLQQRLQNLLTPVRKAIDEKVADFRPDELLRRIADIDQEASKALEATDKLTRDLIAIGKLAAKLPPHDSTLATIIAELEAQYSEEQRARLAEELAAARREADEKLAKAKADSERKIADAKAQAEKLIGEEAANKIVADAKRQQELLAQERKKKEEEAREAALEKEFEKDLPQIRQLLSAFTTPGFSYRPKNAPKGPISFAWLEALGALENSRQGMERLTSVASHQNDRPRGALPFLIGNEFGWRQMPKEPITKAQELLKKYGKLMVKKGMLAE